MCEGGGGRGVDPLSVKGLWMGGGGPDVACQIKKKTRRYRMSMSLGKYPGGLLNPKLGIDCETD